MSSSIFPSQFDVLVVGSGAAGLYAALCLPDTYRVGLITKTTLKTGSSNWAQGGIAAAVDPSDSPKFHLKDTLQAGAGLCELEAVQFLVEQAPASISSLLELGVDFDRRGEQLAMTLEAAHSHPRVLHSADTTGRAIVETLTAQVIVRPNIQLVSQALALKVWLHPETGHCQGISCLHQQRIHWLRAQAVVLATGGGGMVFSQTTNPSVSTGDGVAMAWRAGATLRDLEFFQFHPTALTQPGAPRFLISEAVRGEGAHLVDGQGDRFVFNYHPAGELAPRDVVSRAIFSHLQTMGNRVGSSAPNHVYLDLSPISPERIRHRFPKIIEVCKKWGVDVFQQPIPVAPAAHYWMGGIAVGLGNQTSIPGLYAIGEAASTGVHGANRLASNSLLECVVFAAQLAHIELSSSDGDQGNRETVSSDFQTIPSSEIDDWHATLDQVEIIAKALPQLMWQSAGVYRQGEVLSEAIKQVQVLQTQLKTSDVSRYILDLPPGQDVHFDQPQAETQLKQVAETLNLLDIAALILQSAEFRTESRGGHHRIDYPEVEPAWVVHTLVQGEQVWKSSP